MKIAFLTIDAREPYKKYHLDEPYFGTAPQALMDGFEELGGHEIHVISCLQKPARIPEKLGENIYYHGLVVPNPGWMKTFYSGCVMAVRKKLAEIGPDVIHAQGTERESAICAVLGGQPCPTFLTIHGNMGVMAKIYGAKFMSFYWLAAKLEKFVIPRFSAIVCITKYTRELVEKKAQSTYVIPNAVDGTFFDIQLDPPEKPVILCVGQIDRRKNQVKLINSLDEIAAATGLSIRFFGRVSGGVDDEYGKEFQSLVEAKDWCGHEGFAGRDELKVAISRASMLILPSTEDNCPMVVLEAMAAGVPVIASRVGGIPELIDDEVNGLFCDPADSSSIRDAVKRLIDDPALAKGLSERAKASAFETYHPTRIAQRHLDIYEEKISAAERDGATR